MDMLARYLSRRASRVSFRDRNNGIIGISPFARCRKIRWKITFPSFLNLSKKDTASAIDAAQKYNEVVIKYFGEHAITCDLFAAYELDKKYANMPQLLRNGRRT